MDGTVPESASRIAADALREARIEARRLARSLRTRRPVADEAFDCFMPPALQAVSSIYWTPLAVARLAARWLNEAGVRTLVDVGSGAGKFCVVAALLTRYSISGVERRGQLVAAARDLAALFDVDDRVTFIEGGVGTAEALAPDAYYFFNPFGEYVFRAVEFDDDGIPTDEDVQRDLDATVGLLARAPAGTFVVTYNGFGGSFPPGYEQLVMARRLPGTLRLWKKA
ncbi:MAG: hypothetical protein DIU54_014160 [Acidobacteriota bacterium]|nr:MAG: hypothetical protein DIU54_06000 [Acidobacteriota bacterium]